MCCAGFSAQQAGYSPTVGRKLLHTDAAKARDDSGREESEAERDDRNLAELLQEELRIAALGVQVLFGFLLSLPFTVRFVKLSSPQRDLYLSSLMLAALSTALLSGPGRVSPTGVPAAREGTPAARGERHGDRRSWLSGSRHLCRCPAHRQLPQHGDPGPGTGQPHVRHVWRLMVHLAAFARHRHTRARWAASGRNRARSSREQEALRPNPTIPHPQFTLARLRTQAQPCSSWTDRPHPCVEPRHRVGGRCVHRGLCGTAGHPVDQKRCRPPTSDCCERLRRREHALC